MATENQDLFEYDGPTLDALDPILSRDRLSKYHDLAAGNKEQAYKLYAVNTAVSESLYTPLQMLEVALRNAFHRVLTDRYGNFWVYEPGVITDTFQRQKIKETTQDLIAQKKKLTPSGIVAGLTFGFWTSLLNRKYENTLWRQCIFSVFRGTFSTCREVNGVLVPIRILRNRIAHHEPIIHWNLPKHYENILRITDCLSSDAARWTKAHSRFPELFESRMS